MYHCMYANIQVTNLNIHLACKMSVGVEKLGKIFQNDEKKNCTTLALYASVTVMANKFFSPGF